MALLIQKLDLHDFVLITGNLLSHHLQSILFYYSKNIFKTLIHISNKKKYDEVNYLIAYYDEETRSENSCVVLVLASNI